MTLHPDEIQVIQVLERGAPGDGVTSGEAATILAAIDDFNNTTIPQALDDLGDVAAPSPLLGDSLIFQEIGGVFRWIPGKPIGGIASISDNGVEEDTNVTAINFTEGLGVVAGDPGGGVNVLPVYGGGGSATTIARSDHSHNPAIIYAPQTFAATGALSSGTRVLFTLNAGPLVSGVTYDCKARVVVAVRNDGNSGEVDLGLRIGGSASFPRTANRVRNVGGVDVPHEWVAVRSDANGGAIVGTGSTVQVTADVEFVSGDPTNVRHGFLEFEAHPRR